MDRSYLLTGLGYAIVGLLLGIHMAASKNHGQVVSCLGNSLNIRAISKRVYKARSEGNTGCISKGRNAVKAFTDGSRRARQPRPLAALRLLARTTAIACKSRLARNLGWHADNQRITQTGH